MVIRKSLISFFMIVCFCYFPISYAADPTSFAIGYYGDNNQLTKPLLIVGTRDENIWTFIQKIANFPDTLQFGEFTSLSCNANGCVAGGIYSLQKDPFPYPDLLLISSNDNGLSWQASSTIQNKPSNWAGGGIMSVSCAKSFCAAVGAYWQTKSDVLSVLMRKNSKALPLLLVSRDRGQTWEFKQIDGLSNPNGYFTSISCGDDYCSAVSDNNFITSNEDGSSWTLQPNMHATYISCSQNICAAIGWYEPDQTSHLYTSQNNGLSWMPISSISDIPMNQVNFRFNGISCSYKSCIATGDGSAPQYSNIIVSNDGGLSWSFLQDSKGLIQKIVLYSASCQSSFCIAGGYLHNFLVDSPVLLRKFVNQEWEIIGLPDLGAVTSVNCTDNFCNAAGFTPNSIAPMLYANFDNNNIWVNIQNAVNFPADLRTSHITPLTGSWQWALNYT